MAPNRKPVALRFVVGLGLGVLGALFFRSTEPPLPVPTGPIADPVPPPAARPAPSPIPAAPGDEREQAILATRLPTTITPPLQTKYRDARWSAVPAQLVAAFDEAGEGAPPGENRNLLLVVTPGISNDELARLVRDVRDAHADAVRVTLRVFDSLTAATHPVQDRTAPDVHLVAEWIRKPESERATLRGAVFEP